MPVAQGLLVQDREHVTELLTTSDIAYSKAAGYELDSYENMVWMPWNCPLRLIIQ